MRRFFSALLLSFLFLMTVPAYAQDAPDAATPAAVEGHAVEPGDDVPDAGAAPVGDAGAAAPAPAVDIVPGTPEVTPAPDAPSATDAPSAPTTDAEAVELVKDAVQAARDGSWPLFAGLVLFLIIFAANRFGLAKKVGRKAVPWVTAAVGVGGSLAIGLVGGVPVTEALMHGFFASAEAIALWELVFKHIMAAKSDGSSKEAVDA
jgi:hypothetical protein